MTSLRVRLSSLRVWLQARPRVHTAAIAVTALVGFFVAGAVAWAAYDITAGLPDRTAIRGLGDMAQSTTIYDDHDTPAFTIFKEQRIEVPLEKISPNLVKATLSVEDQRFYEHGGIDFIRVAAAVVHNLHEGRRAEGGSTITQQLARQSFLSRDKTFRRKLKEAVLAAHIEHEYSKHDILEMYLNKVYFGDGLYGAEAASLGYFGRHASELSVDQAALLAGLIQSPSSYAPTVNMDRAVARRNVVLQTMLASGAIDQAQYDRARRADVTLTNSLEMKETFGLYFKEQVRRELVDRFGWQRVAQGGLKVYTTIDPALQQAAEKIVESGLESIEKRRGYKHPLREGKESKELSKESKEKESKEKDSKEQESKEQDTEGPDYLQGALVSLDPSTGEVRALVGGRDFIESRFNRATQARRQSGSAFKPFVYAAALEAGYSPASLITNLNNPVLTPQGDWVPEDEHSTASEMTMRSALKISSNRAAVQMLNTIGIPKAVSYAERLNVGTPPSVPSLALGTSEVTLLSLSSAYAAFADGGVVHAPVFIRRVEDADGKVLLETKGKTQQAVTPATAFLMSSMLADVVNAGTAYKVRQAGFTLPAAGKTGTTNDYVDAWFVGYTPHLLTGVWVGFDQPATIVANGYAGDLAVPIWSAFMKIATRGDKPDWFEKPSNVVGVNVCRLSGKLPNVGCGNVQVERSDGFVETRSMIYTDYFLKGSQPTTVCPLHPGGAIGVLADSAGVPIGAPAMGGQSQPAPTTGTIAPAPPTDVTGGTVEEPKKKKRGFWSRLFGGGDDKKKSEESRKPKGPGGA